MKKGCLLGFFIFCFALSKAQVPNYLIYDKDQSHHFGAENLTTIHKLIYQNLEKLVPIKIWDEEHLWKKASGIGYRMLKLGVTGFQVDVNTVLYQHEVFGHGARNREFGHIKRRYSFRHFFPFDFGGSAGGEPTYPISTTQNLLITSGGVEGDLILSEKLEERFIVGDKLHYRQSLLFLIARNNLLRYAYSNISGSGDISSYVTQLNRSLGRTSPNATISTKQLFRQNLVVLLNPMQWFAVWNLSKNYLLDGETTFASIPMIKLGNLRYLPSLNYNLTPFGGEFIVNNYFTREGRLMLLKLRIGDDRFRKHYGGGVKLLNLINREKFKLNTTADVWYQPAFSYGTESDFVSVNEGIGVMLQGSISYFPFPKAPSIGVHGMTGYKTAGYLMGERLEKGPILRLGLALNLD